MKKLLLLFLISFLSTPLLAEGFNDNYIQLGYSTSDYKHTDKITNISGSAEFGNNYSISGSYSYETGDWNDPQEYETLTSKKTLIGIGKSFPLSPSTDITSSFSIEKWNNKHTTDFTAKSVDFFGTTYTTTSSSSSYKIDFSHASIGIKSLTAAGFEISLKNTWTRAKTTTTLNYYTPSIGVRNISDSGLELSFKYSTIKGATFEDTLNKMEFELMKHINENFAIGGRVVSQKKPDWTEKGIFVRRNF